MFYLVQLFVLALTHNAAALSTTIRVPPDSCRAVRIGSNMPEQAVYNVASAWVPGSMAMQVGSHPFLLGLSPLSTMA